MATQPVRIEADTYQEVQGASRLLGRTPAELLARAWDQFKVTDEFRKEFHHVQQIVASGDLAELTRHLDYQTEEWAEDAAAEIQALRNG